MKHEPKKEGVKLPLQEAPEMLGAHAELKLLTEQQEQRIQDLENVAKRLQAEFDNFRKQTDKQKQELQLHGNASLMQKLLPMLDELEHSLKAAKSHGAASEILEGFEMVYQNLLRALQNEGLKEMDVRNETFDPYQHEALRQEESDLPEGKVICVVRKGYRFNDKVLRPASVVVSNGKKKGDTHA